MMFWYGHDVSGWGWFAMAAGQLLIWGLIITAAVLLIRALNRFQARPRLPATPSAEVILRERLARGEIDEDDYRRRLNTLHAGPLTKS
ncbi:SHOCT domain-containing protein [Streptomyces minutiscleroticus]|uniref:SHOCT domain-containing protein n=1 Tax=Streptomyces minutiscleroticus TaxID=68238 RepID=UPI003325D199